MAIVATDWTIDRVTGNIRYTGNDHNGGSPSYATVIEFHRWLQGLADDAVATAANGDELDITNTDPSRRSTDNYITLINGYNIDATASEHLYDGSIVQAGGDEIYDGIVNYGNAAVQIQIIQDGAVLADDWWNYNSLGLNADAAQGISHRFMLPTRTGGTDIDGRRLIGTCRRFGFTYAEFSINGTARGNNVLALVDSSDLNNTTIAGTVSGWTGITNVTEGYKLLDVNNDTTMEPYYSEWDRSTYTINQFYERMKWLTRDGSSSTLYGLNGELFRGITHQVPLDSGSQSATNFSAFEKVTWSGGEGQMFAINDINAGTKMWIQLLKGVPPTNGQTITGFTSTATINTNGSVTERPLSKPFCGASTGSAIIASYGLSLQTADLTSADRLTDLDAQPRTPPNNVTNTVDGLVSGEDYVLVAPWNGSSYDTNGDPAITKTQFSLTTALTTANITSVVVDEAIPGDTPAAGYLRVTDNNGYERRLHYSSYNGGTKTFAIDTTDGNEDFNVVNASVGNDIYLGYIDQLAGASSLAYTSVQSGTRTLVVIVRDGGGSPIKQFISPWSQTSSNKTITAIRTTDL